MTVAEIHGKLSVASLSERREDLLTSDVFGCLRYLPPQEVLVPFLKTARSLSGKTLSISSSISAAHYAFWPSLRALRRAACEPDVVLGLETDDGIHLIMIEAKYHSGPSSLENNDLLPHHQLAREMDQLSAVSCADLNWETPSEPGSRTLLYVTKDMTMPEADMGRACLEYSSKRAASIDIYWTSWRFLPSILESTLVHETIPERRAIVDDMLRLLERKWLMPFSGVDRVEVEVRLPDFYQLGISSYDWPDMTLAMRYSYQSASGRYTWPETRVPPGFSYTVLANSYEWPDAPSELWSYEYVVEGEKDG